jgi:hypothetical protein
VQGLAGGALGWERSVVSLSPRVVRFPFELSCFFYLYLLERLVCFYSFTTFSDGCLGSNNDEGRSEV